MAVVYLLSMLVLFHGCCCLKNVYLSVPNVVRTGGNLNVICSYTLENETLYSVKLYHQRTEFYRYVPKDEPPIKVFTPPNVSFIVENFNNDSCVNLTMRGIYRDMTGVYSCEVSADAPTFHTYLVSNYVGVTEEPKEKPKVTADKDGYIVGQTLEAKCVSKGGFPSPNLTWFVNGKEIRSRRPSILKQYVEGNGGNTFNSISEIQLLVTPAMHDAGSLRLSCAATQFDLYNSTTDLVIEELTPENSGSERWTQSSSALLIVAVWSFLMAVRR